MKPRAAAVGCGGAEDEQSHALGRKMLGQFIQRPAHTRRDGLERAHGRRMPAALGGVNVGFEPAPVSVTGASSPIPAVVLAANPGGPRTRMLATPGWMPTTPGITD